MSLLRISLGAIPALLVVLFAGIIAILALLANAERRQYALDFVKLCVELAAVLVGASTPAQGSLHRVGEADSEIDVKR